MSDRIVLCVTCGYWAAVIDGQCDSCHVEEGYSSVDKE